MSTAEGRTLERLGEAAPLFAALGDTTRIELLGRLSGGAPESIARLSAGTALTRQAVTKHLTVLERVGLVRSRRRGREHLWQLEPQRLDDARGWLDVISRQWDDALERLKQFVEQPE
jgi:DNA-binding transcriptional ArsR family regulator